MSISAYEFLSILQVRDDSAKETGSDSFDYVSVLEYVRSEIATNHAASLSSVLDDESSAKDLKGLIMKYTVEYMSGMDYDRNALVDRIYNDMASLGVLTEYLHDPAVEEVNINGYKVIEVSRPDLDRPIYLRDEKAFPTPQEAVVLTKRMCRMGGMLLDAQTPRVDSYIGGGTRISAIIPPLVPEEFGVIVSIRKQSKSRLTRDQLIRGGCATADMLDFLSMCLCYGVSVGIAGSTGSGKSTLEGFLLNDYIVKNDDYNNRIFIIEDTRELNLLEYDNDNDRPARVLYTKTKGPPNPVSMYDLIKNALRFNPTLIVPAEVRDGAAYQAAEAGRTGHTILTSFHADGTIDGYDRLVSMCHMAGTNESNDDMYHRCIKAWPIMIFQKQLKDNSRKIMEIFEATGYKNGEVQGEVLYRFDVEQIDRDDRGNIKKVHGTHKRVGNISNALRKRLRNNGAPVEHLNKLFPDV